MKDKFVLAAVQASPIYFDRQASTDRACELIAEAGATGADIAAFGETWLPGYPFFALKQVDALRWRAGEIYLDQSVSIPGPETDQLCAAAKAAAIDVVIGVAEIDQRTRGTVYCTALAISRDGQILGTHRKIKPTFQERMVWGEGSGDDFNVYERPYGRMSSLNCWEHQMVLPGYAMMAQGTEVHVASWPWGDPETAPEPPISVWPRQELLSRAFAAQGACYVIAVGAILDLDCVQDEFKEMTVERRGSSLIIDPRGEVVAKAPAGEQTILLHEADRAILRAARVGCDVTGHYSRPDILELIVNGKSATSISPIVGPLANPADGAVNADPPIK